VKLRVGIFLWILSWVPYGIIFGLSGVQLTLAWTAEITLGIVGLALAGTEFAQAIKANGWKGAPRAAAHSFLHGQDIASDSEATGTPTPTP
jgi:hypothetical protein